LSPGQSLHPWHVAVLVLLPLIAALLPLTGWRVARVGRWIPVCASAYVLVVGIRAMVYEQTFIGIPLRNTPFILLLWDWGTVIIVAAALTATALAFALSDCRGGGDSLVLFNLAVTSAAAVVGNPVSLWPILAISGLSAALVIFGSPPPVGGLTILGGLLALGAAAAAALGLASAIVASGHDVLALFDLTQFPSTQLGSLGRVHLHLFGGLAALCGAFPFAAKLTAEWRSSGTRVASGALAAGPAAVAFAAWLRIAAHGRGPLASDLSPQWVRNTLFALAAAGAVYYACLMLVARDDDGLRGASLGLQVAYATLSLCLAAGGTARGFWAFGAWLATSTLGLGGLSLADRVRQPPVRVALGAASWACILGTPPFVGFLARFLLLHAVAEGMGAWWSLLLVPWIAEVAAVLSHHSLAVGAVPAPAADRDERIGLGHRLSATGWSTAVLFFQAAAGPLALAASDALARQMVTGGV